MDLITQKQRSTIGILLEASLDAMLTISASGEITDMNLQTENLFGLSKVELVGTLFYDYFDHTNKTRKLSEAAVGVGDLTQAKLRQKNGSFIDILFKATSFKNSIGAGLGSMIVIRLAGSSQEDALYVANKEIAFQGQEMEKRADELVIANEALVFQKDEKEKRAKELIIANKELRFQNTEKGKRADELKIANKELAFQNVEKKKRAKELIIANKELAVQDKEKGERANELVIANIELLFQNEEKHKRAEENRELAIFSKSQKLASQYVRSLIEASIDPLLTISPEWKITDVNEASVQVTGETREKLIGTDFSDYFTEPEKAREGYKQVFENGTVADYSLTIKHKTGKLTDVLYNASLYKDAKGKVLGVFAAARDVTAQKSLSNYSLSLIEASRDPLFTISPQGKITDVNQATERVTGLKRIQLIGTDFFNYFTDKDKARNGYELVFEKGFVKDYPLTLMDGVLTDALFNGSVYKDDRANVLGAVMVARDITEQKRIENELIHAKLFAEKVSKNAEEAKHKAESATIIAINAVKAKQQFLSNMSHEIRTPMNAIIGFTKVLLKTDLTKKQMEYLEAIKSSGDALIVLINDILDLAKVDAGKVSFEHTPFKMNQSIPAMVHLFETKILEKNLKLIKNYDANIPEVLVGDPVRLHQIILNLLSNAVKFTSKGTITVSVNLFSEDKEKACIEFVIQDTGIGIEHSKIDSIFEDFQQASSGTSRLYGGTGLGLAIVKQLVEKQGGSISVVSELNVGSTFSFKIEFFKTKADASVVNTFLELDSDVKNIEVLVVEDITLNQLLMKTILDEFGFKCDVASNGKLAVEKLESKTYDIILMDLQMPVMNGFEATEYIRNKMHLKVPIIALTADVTTVDLQKCKLVGMNDYLAKPVDDRLLYNKILSLVKPIPIMGETAEVSLPKPKCIDLEYLSTRTKSNPILMMEMISLYLEQTPPLIQAMRQSFLAQDWNTLQATVHKMIPSFSIVGINPDFEKMAQKVQEFAASQQQTGTISDLVEQIENICLQACTELIEELNEIKIRQK